MAAESRDPLCTYVESRDVYVRTTAAEDEHTVYTLILSNKQNISPREGEVSAARSIGPFVDTADAATAHAAMVARVERGEFDERFA